MRRFKCLSVDTTNMRHFTIGKIYETDDNMLNYRLDGGHYCPLIENGDVACGLVFEEIKEEGENKMEDLRELLKVGYIVKFEDNKLSKIEINSYAELSFSGEHWFPLERLKSDLTLTYSDMKIIEVYGRCSSNADAWKLSTDNRELIWKRTEISPTQLKLEELEKKQREIANEMEKLRKEL